MKRRYALALTCTWAALASAAEDSATLASTPAVNAQLAIAAPELDTPAARALRKVPLQPMGATALPLSKADAAKLKPHLTLDEIRIYSYREPEDYVRKEVPKMLAFRSYLDNIRPRTPAEIWGVLCIICPIAEAPGSSEERTESRARQTTSQMQATRGTLQ